MTAQNILPFFKVTNSASGTTEIDITGDIGFDFMKYIEDPSLRQNTIDAIKNEIKGIGSTDRIQLNINGSSGGDLNTALVIRDMLIAFPSIVDTVVRGFSASAATVLAQSASSRTGKKGGKRKMTNTARYLIHEGQMGVYGTAKDLADGAGMLDGVSNDIAALYAENSNKPASFYRDLMLENNGRGRWLTANEALDFGLVDEIIGGASTPVYNKAEFDKYNLPPLEEVITNQNFDMSFINNLKKMLGLSDGATEQEVTNAVTTALQERADVQASITSAVGALETKFAALLDSKLADVTNAANAERDALTQELADLKAKTGEIAQEVSNRKAVITAPAIDNNGANPVSPVNNQKTYTPLSRAELEAEMAAKGYHITKTTK